MLLNTIAALVERYDEALREEEDDAIARVNTALDTGFGRLMRRVNGLLRDRSETDVVTLEAQAARARQLSGLLMERNPAKADVYQQTYERLSERATTLGLDHSSDLLRTTSPNVQLRTVDIPIEAIQQAGARSRGYLQRYGDKFANDATAEVQAAMAEGLDFATLTNRLEQKLKVTKIRADMMARTESLGSFNSAAQKSMTKHGVRFVVWYATKDERTCPVCAARHGSIYKLGEAKAPCHPRCRCRLAAVTPEAIAATPLQRDLRADYKKIRNRVTELGGSLDRGPAPFEDRAPSPIWTPSSRSNKLEDFT